jgi:hypothetical protein
VRNDQPCFSYPQDKEIQKHQYSFSSLSVSKAGPVGGVSWEIQKANQDGRGLMKFNSPETCIEYGVLPLETKDIKPAKPLLFDTSYRMLLVVYSRSGGVLYERRYSSDFCFTRNTKGEKIIVGTDWESGENEPHCLKPGELPKRNFWQKLFGK